MKLSINDQNGFTLVELVVVIGILIILAGVVISTLNIPEYLKEARDAKRVSEILSVQKAILSGLADSSIELTNTSTCTSCDSASGTRNTNGQGWIKYKLLSGQGLGNFILYLPEDPINERDLKYSYYSDGASYELNAVFESEKYSVNALNDGGNEIYVYERGTSLILN